MDKLCKITLFNDDCMNILQELPEKSFDLAIIDPPYGINAPNMSMGTHKTRKKDGYPGVSIAQKLKKDRILNSVSCNWDITKPTDEYFNELFRVSKNQIIWGGNYFNLPPSRCWICWDKKQPWESFSQFELAWTSFNQPAAMFRFSNRGGANKEKKIHPTQKPVELYKWILSKFAKQGYKILDTHGGSMTNARACADLGFELTIIEKDLHYYNSAKEALNEYLRPLKFSF